MGGAAVDVDVEPVGLIPDDDRVRAQGVEDALGYHPGAAVGAVEADAQALVGVRGEAYEVAYVAVAPGGIVHRAAYPRAGREGRLAREAVEIGLYLVEDALLHLLALGVYELYPVVVIGVVARAYHDAAVEVVHAGDVAH